MLADLLVNVKKYQHWPSSMATWEDLVDLFPHAPAWGQLVFQEGETVSRLSSIMDRIAAQEQRSPMRLCPGLSGSACKLAQNMR